MPGRTAPEHLIRDAAARLVRARVDQGLPPQVTDPDALRVVAEHIRAAAAARTEEVA